MKGRPLYRARQQVTGFVMTITTPASPFVGAISPPANRLAYGYLTAAPERLRTVSGFPEKAMYRLVTFCDGMAMSNADFAIFMAA
ncbi:hypothetical protein A7D27_13145 [Pseudomonas sp. 1D4]|nr:hypothetical protein A7D27_13145 [Pseudomonas sp. 1D4]